MKNTSIFGIPNRIKASNPRDDAIDPFLPVRVGGHGGIVKQYKPIITPAAALIYNWFGLRVHPQRSTAHAATINPTVPQTRIGGKSLTILNPLFSKTI